MNEIFELENIKIINCDMFDDVGFKELKNSTIDAKLLQIFPMEH